MASKRQDSSSSSSSEDEGDKQRNNRKNPNPKRRMIKRPRENEGLMESERWVRPRHERFLENLDFDDWFEKFMEEAVKEPEVVIPKPIEWMEFDGKVSTLDDLIELGKSYDANSLQKFYFPQDRLHQLVEPLTELNKMIGMDKLKETLLNHILFFCQDLEKRSAHMMHTVISGPPGSGKTCVANILAKIYAKMGFLKHDKVHSVRRSDLIGQYLGQTAIKTQKAIDEAKGGVLLIDEAYSLGNPEGRDMYSKECIDTLCQNLSEGKGEFICIIIGYKESLEKCFFAYNPGLERRFPYRYNMDEYSPEQLWRILRKMVEEADWKWELEEKKVLEFLTKNRHYYKYNGGDLETFFQMLKLSHGKRVFGKNPILYKILSWDDWEKGFDLFLKNDDIKNRREMDDIPALGMYS